MLTSNVSSVSSAFSASSAFSVFSVSYSSSPLKHLAALVVVLVMLVHAMLVVHQLEQHPALVLQHLQLWLHLWGAESDLQVHQ